MPKTKTVVAFWITTAVFSLWMLFTAYWELSAPLAAQTFTQLGFPAHFFRVELSLAKVVGVAILLLPTPQRLKEWAYAGFAINLGSALLRIWPQVRARPHRHTVCRRSHTLGESMGVGRPCT